MRSSQVILSLGRQLATRHASKLWNTRRLLSTSSRCFQENVVPKETRKVSGLTKSYVHCASTVPLMDSTIGQLMERAADAYGDQDSIIDLPQGRRSTFSKMLTEADELAASFLSLGLQKGDRLAIWGPNSYEWCLTYYAAARAGLVLVTLNPAFQTPEVKYCLNKVGVKAVVCPENFLTQKYYKMILEAAPGIEHGITQHSSGIPTLEHVIVITDKELPGAIRFRDLQSSAGSNELHVVHNMQRLIQSSEPCNIQFTSGTTGNPKAATLSHHNVVNNSRALNVRYDIKPMERSCLPVPLFHVSANVGYLLTGLHMGSTTIIPSQLFDPVACLETIQNEKCSIIFAVPTMYVDMVSVPDVSKYDLSSLKYMVVGAASCPVQLMHKMKEVFKPEQIIGGYGMTETSPMSFCTTPDDSYELISQTTGFPSYHCEAKIIDDEGNIVPIGTPGELCVRGYLNMLGYWGDEEKTREILSIDGWLKTGDTFIMNENGYGSVVGRKKEMINRGGENVYPREIEEFLHTHPGVLEAHVIGVPDERLGEEVCAWFRLKPDQQELTEEDIREFCKGKLSHYKVPKYVFCEQNFPRTASGKVQKFKLVETSVERLGLRS